MEQSLTGASGKYGNYVNASVVDREKKDGLVTDNQVEEK